MRRLYLTLQDHFLIDGLLDQDPGAVREPFWELLFDDGLSWLVAHGAETYKDLYMGRGPTEKLPFIPHLGALRLSHKAQVEHRALRPPGFPRPQTVASSPTGLRLYRRESELVSEHRLADTYRGDDARALSRRVSREGHTDHFIGDDESTWHVAVSVEPRQRIAVSAETEEARSAMGTGRVSARAYLHIYPYGALTVTLCLTLDHGREASLSETIALLRQLTGRRGKPSFTYTMRGLDPTNANANDLILQLASRTFAAIEPSARAPNVAAPHYAVSVAATRDDLSDRELAGLLTLDARYELFKEDWVKAQASLYGRYDDRVLVSHSGLAVATSPLHFPPSGRRRFFWRLHAIKEFAECQAHVVRAIASRLEWVGTRKGPDERVTTRLLAIGEHLIEFHRGLPAHHRKWFYECQRAVGGPQAIDEFYAAVARMHEDARQAAMLARMDDARKVTINIDRSQIASLNLGTITGNVEAHLSAISGNERDELRDALTSLAQAVVDAERLDDTRRRELLQSIDLLAEEAAKDPQDRRDAAVRPVLSALSAGAGAAADLASVWATVGPIIVNFFA